MNLNEVKLKIKENKVSDNLVSPRFIITYDAPKGFGKEASSISQKIISRLSEKKYILIEVNSSLLSIQGYAREKIAIDFIDGIKSLSIDFRYRQIPGRSSGGFFSNLIKRNPETDHEVIALIPENHWNNPAFRSLIPDTGTRYYICNDNDDPEKILDNMYKTFISDTEKLGLFKYIIFDCPKLSQMGIISSSVTFEELQKILN